MGKKKQNVFKISGLWPAGSVIYIMVRGTLRDTSQNKDLLSPKTGTSDLVKHAATPLSAVVNYYSIFPSEVPVSCNRCLRFNLIGV